MTELLTTREAAISLKLSEMTLRRWRLEGEGPRFLKLGRAVRYDPQTIAEFVASRERENTSQGEAR